jgi:hypothetical protein
MVAEFGFDEIRRLVPNLSLRVGQGCGDDFSEGVRQRLRILKFRD